MGFDKDKAKQPLSALKKAMQSVRIEDKVIKAMQSVGINAKVMKAMQPPSYLDKIKQEFLEREKAQEAFYQEAVQTSSSKELQILDKIDDINRNLESINSKLAILVKDKED